MHIVAIGNIINDSQTVGIRLLDVDSNQVKDVPMNSIKNAIESGKIQIDNLTVEDDRVMGKNGDIDDLPKIVDRQVYQDSPLVIVGRVGKEAYLVSDYAGSITELNNEEILSYAKNQGISNGEIKRVGDKEFINSMYSEYIDEILQLEGKAFTEKDEKSIRESLGYVRDLINNALVNVGFISHNNYGKVEGNIGVYTDSWLKYEGTIVRLVIGYEVNSQHDEKFDRLSIDYNTFSIGQDFKGREKIKMEYLTGKIGRQTMKFHLENKAEKFYPEVYKFLQEIAPVIKKDIDRILTEIRDKSFILSTGSKVSKNLTTIESTIDIKNGGKFNSKLKLKDSNNKQYILNHRHDNEKDDYYQYRYEVLMNEGDKWKAIATLGDGIDINEIGIEPGINADPIMVIYHMIVYWTYAIDYIENKFY